MRWRNRTVIDAGLSSPEGLLAARANSLLQIEKAEAEGNQLAAAEARKTVQRLQRLITRRKLEG